MLEATSHKTAAVLPPSTHLEDYPNYSKSNVGHGWRSKDELISDVLLWSPSYGRASVGRLARTCLQQHRKRWMIERERERERERDREGEL